jgi:hypothetical protein
MTTQLASPRTDISRDRWGRPLIEPIGGGKPEPYTRVSTLAKVLDDKTALTKWKQRMTALGIGLRPDLAQLASVVKDDNQRLDAVVEEAMSAAQVTRPANIGTTLHALTEFLDRGEMPPNVPDSAWPDLTAYENATKDIEVLGSELFVVVDELKAGGSFDRLVRLPDGRVMVADIKTGQHEPRYPHAATTQIAIYSRGHLYEPGAGRIGHLPDLGVDQDHGLLIHLPAGTGICDLYLLDLQVGWELACTATEVRARFRDKPISAYSPKK